MRPRYSDGVYEKAISPDDFDAKASVPYKVFVADDENSISDRKSIPPGVTVMVALGGIFYQNLGIGIKTKNPNASRVRISSDSFC